MWKNINGRLIHTTDQSITRFKTYISQEQLFNLTNLATDYHTHISYLLENGLKNIVSDTEFTFNKKLRLRDKVEFRTTCNKEILFNAKEFAKTHNLNFTDVIQASISYIKLSEVKSKEWRYRIE